MDNKKYILESFSGFSDELDLKLFNTPKGKKESFKSINSDEVLMYSCGPTVYSDAHIGNLRSYIFPDVLKKVLKLIGYRIKHIINITDVGHLTDDASDGDDKMELSAKKVGNNVWDLSRKYTDAFISDISKLNIELPVSFTKATDYIKEQIDMICSLEEKGFTYKTKDGIYFDTSKFPDYAKFGKLDIDNLNKGNRVDFGDKKSVTDFALWKFSPKNEKRQMEWDSPWGLGFPGWHIECSAMIDKELGNQIDIHTGGTDHIKVHHSNEVAQATCCNGIEPVNYWLHGEFLVLDNKKRIGKSEGNSITLSSLVDSGFDPLSYRYLVLMAHYRSFLTFSEEILSQAQSGLKKLKNEVKTIIDNSGGIEVKTKLGNTSMSYINLIMKELLNDLNTPKALAIFRKSLKDDKLENEEKLIIISIFDEVFSLGLLDVDQEEIPNEIKNKAEERWSLKNKGNYQEADIIRDSILEMGYVIKDEKGTYSILKK